MKFKHSLFLILAMLLVAEVRAERADIEKKVQASADKLEKAEGPAGYGSIVANGHAVLTKGTLIIQADSIEVTYTDKNGWHGEVNAFSQDGVTKIRQKREGADRWIEGESRSVYVNLLDNYAILALHGDAKMRQIAGDKTVDESTAGGISYDMRADSVSVFAPAAPPANALTEKEAQPYVCSGEKYVEVRSIAKLEPKIAKMMEGVTDRGGEFNAGDVGMPGTRFALAAVSKDVALVAVERGGRGYSVYLWFFYKRDGNWQRGQDFPFHATPPKSLSEFLAGASRAFDCKTALNSG